MEPPSRPTPISSPIPLTAYILSPSCHTLMPLFRSHIQTHLNKIYFPCKFLAGVLIKLGDVYCAGSHIILLYYHVSEIIMAMEITAEPGTNYPVTLHFGEKYSENYKQHNRFAKSLLRLKVRAIRLLGGCPDYPAGRQRRGRAFWSRSREAERFQVVI